MSNFFADVILVPKTSVRHCERSEAIHSAACGEMDCFVASLLAMTAADAVALPSLLPVAHAHAGADVALDAVGCDRVAQAVLGELLHAGDGFRKMGRLQRH